MLVSCPKNVSWSLLILNLVVSSCASLHPPSGPIPPPAAASSLSARQIVLPVLGNTPFRHRISGIGNRVRRLALDGPAGEKSEGPIVSNLTGGGGGVTNTRATIELAFLVLLWYTTSIYYTNTTRSLSMHWGVMALVQVIIASICSIITIPAFNLSPGRRIRLLPSRAALRTTGALAISFGAGFVFLNAALCMMHVSLVMVLRALEPLSMAALSLSLLGESTSLRAGGALVSICTGSALSAAESADFTGLGLLVTFCANLSFSLCAIFAKKLKQEHGVDDYNIFLQCSTLSAPLFLAMLLVLRAMNVDLMLPAAVEGFKSGVLILNGISFFVYNQFAWIVLGRVSAVTYTVMAAVRKTFVCICGVIQFGNPVSPLSAFGIGLTSIGSLFYADAKRVEAEASVKEDA